MLHQWRLLSYSSADPAMNLAIEEAVLRCKLEQNGPDTLRLWQNSPAVVIGSFQNSELEVETSECEKLGVNVFRRISGGGAVYHDFGNLNYSIFVKKSAFSSQVENVEKSYEIFCSGIKAGLETLGVEAHIQEGNIMVGKKKISGSAQYRLHDAILHHGTLMVNVNLNKLGSTLGISDPEKILLNLNQFSPEISLCEIKNIVTKGFERTFNVKFRRGTLTSRERQTAKALYEMKYCRKDWNEEKMSILLEA